MAEMSLTEQATQLLRAYDTLACDARLLDVAEGVLPESMLTGRAHNVMFCETHALYHVYDAQHVGVLRQQVQRDLRIWLRDLLRGTMHVRQNKLVGYEAQMAAAFAGHVAATRQGRRLFVRWREEQLRVAAQELKGGKHRLQKQAALATANEQMAGLTAEQQVEFYRCFRKHVFVFEAEARVALAEKPPLLTEQLSVYSCEFCSGWHLGHTPRRARQSGASYLRQVQYSFLKYPQAAREFTRLISGA